MATIAGSSYPVPSRTTMINKKLQIINPLDFPEWNSWISKFPESTFFHTAEWAEVISKTYRYTPHYFAIRDEDSLAALIPLMEVRSILTGNRGVSLPFSDYCQPLISEALSSEHLLQQIIDFGQKQSWKWVEFRGSCQSQTTSATAYFYRHQIAIADEITTLFSRCRHSTRTNIKKARKSGLTVNIERSSAAMNEFYRLNCLTRKRHGLPPQPHAFFKNVQKNIVEKGLGSIFIVSHNNKNIAAAVAFEYAREIIIKYAAYDIRYQQYRPNNLMIWEAIKHYNERGFETFCFGRTDIENNGLRQFKNGWGVTEQKIPYFRIDLLGEKKSQENYYKHPGVHNRFFAKMPVALLKLLGSLLYRHAG